MPSAEKEPDTASAFRFYRDLLLAVTANKLFLVFDRDQMPHFDGIGPDIERKIESLEDLAAIKKACDGFLRGSNIDDSKVFDIVISVSEAVSNVLKHAEKGFFRLFIKDSSCFVLVSDSGKGMPLDEIPSSVQPGHSSKDSLGMGFSIMLELAEAAYIYTDSKGTVLLLKISLDRKSSIPDLSEENENALDSELI